MARRKPVERSITSLIKEGNLERKLISMPLIVVLTSLFGDGYQPSQFTVLRSRRGNAEGLGSNSALQMVPWPGLHSGLQVDGAKLKFSKVAYVTR